MLYSNWNIFKIGKLQLDIFSQSYKGTAEIQAANITASVHRNNLKCVSVDVSVNISVRVGGPVTRTETFSEPSPSIISLLILLAL